jgi:hypothetical protein
LTCTDELNYHTLLGWRQLQLHSVKLLPKVTMRIQSALFLLVGLPAAMAAAVSPLSLSKAAEEHGEIFKRGATCYNTSKYNNGHKNIP